MRRDVIPARAMPIMRPRALRRDPIAELPDFATESGARALVVRRHAQARRLRLAVDPRDGTVRLTLPPRAALAPALAWVEGKRGWIEAQLARTAPDLALASGASIPVEGVARLILWQADAPRRVALTDDRLVVGGPHESVPARLLRWLKARAAERLTAETGHYAALAGVSVGRIGVGDPRSRWGSCSAAGDIRYSWRLILAPPEVRRATVAHEVAHRLHMDHSAAFHAAAARLFGRDPAPERAWLRTHGAALHAVGRE